MITAAQLRDAGIARTTVTRRVRAGRLHRVYRGVYAVGHPGLSREGRWVAAVLACGRGAVLSHRSAAELWKLLPPRVGPIHVTVPANSGGRSRRTGLRIHRSSLPRTATTARCSIAVTAPARTLADLERTADPATHRRAVRQAEYLGLPLGDAPTDHTRSELEHRFLSLCRCHRLPEPEVNARVGRFTIDFLWRDQRLAVETDGYAAHRGRQAFEDDRQRELELGLAGIRVRRFTATQINDSPRRVAAVVRAELGAPIRG